MEDVVVVGAGWAGLAAAHRLRAAGCDPLVIEAHGQVGGAASTHRDGNWLLEAGPHAFFQDHPALKRFLQESGGSSDLVPARPDARDQFVTRNGRRVALPRAPPGLVTTPLLSPMAKLRLLAEPLVRRSANEEESVAAFARRRFGAGVDALVDALVTGVFAGDPERLSLPLAFPRLAAAECQQGSILRGMRRTTPRPRALVAPRQGMGPWLADRSTGLRVVTGGVQQVARSGPFRLLLDDEVVEARRVILALPPQAAARLLGVAMDPLPTAPVAVVGLGWQDGRVPGDRFAGYGVLHPESEGRFSLGALYESSLFPERAARGGTLIRALVGGRRHPVRAALPDETLVAQTVADVLDLHDLDVPPDWTCVLRPPPIPQPEMGHDKRLAPLNEQIDRIDGLTVAGWGWRTVGIAESVQSGQAAADRSCRQPHGS